MSIRLYPRLLWQCLIIAVLLACMPVPQADAASLDASFNTAWREFHALSKDKRKAKYRENWLRIEQKFVDVYKRSPRSSYAPKALFYAGRTRTELGARSFLSSDFRKAVDYYGRLASHFPSHSWTDDGLYQAALVNKDRLNDLAAARRDLNAILRDHQQGDMYYKALALHRSLDGKGTATAQASPKPVQKAPAPKVSKPVQAEPVKASRIFKSKTISSGPPATLVDVRYQSSDDYTRVVLECSKEVAYRYQFLPEDRKAGKPYRLYVDIENATPGKLVRSHETVADGILKEVRTGRPRDGVSRVVLDFSSVRKYNVFTLDNPFRVVIDVTSPDDKSEDSVQVAQTKPEPKAPPKPYQVPSGSKGQVKDLVEQLGLTLNTIMIDAGHGGKDPGTQHNGIREREYTLKMVKIIGRKLEAKGFNVLYTRTKDVFVPLEDRTAMANVKKADMFLSVHINANNSSKIHGFETYYLNLARSASAVRVAARENAVSEKRISDLQFILTDLMLNSKMQESKDLAELIQKNVIGTVKKKYGYSTRDNGVRSAPFYVLMGAKMPSVLVELGYCTNPSEARRLKSEKYLERMAEGIVDGVVAYKKKINRYASM
ncbi:N-acetylmuramoyl-L-alanine amidase [Oleidesulfovibrio sp.]|uniref:N-acetylmuramoyl-L-alanine amidase n=1 Tax=Oleidesulfovibrio sp. TaxID=2909707 RepID=UPI003A849212